MSAKQAAPKPLILKVCRRLAWGGVKSPEKSTKYMRFLLEKGVGF